MPYYRRELLILSRIRRTFWVCTGAMEEGQEQIFYVGIGIDRGTRVGQWSIVRHLV